MRDLRIFRTIRKTISKLPKTTLSNCSFAGVFAKQCEFRRTALLCWFNVFWDAISQNIESLKNWSSTLGGCTWPARTDPGVIGGETADWKERRRGTI